MSRVSSSPKTIKTEKPVSPYPQEAFEYVLLKAIIIILAGFLIFAPAYHGGWLWDDDQEITANPLLPQPLGWITMWMPGKTVDYLPLTGTVEWMLWRVFHNDSTGYHLVTISLHILCGLLIWHLFTRLRIRQSWLGGLLFVVHPIVAESVAWVSELKNTLSLPFLLLSMLAYLNFGERRNWGPYVASLLLFFTALLCKASIIMFPLVILLYCWWKRGRISLFDLATSIPFGLISAAAAVVTIWLQWGLAIGNEVVPLGGFWSRLASAGMAISFYLGKCLFPIGLLPIYPRWDVDPPTLIQFLPWPILIGALIWFWTQRKTWGRPVLFGFGFFLINLFPVMGFIKMSFMRITWVSDHLTYVPLIGLVGLVTACVGDIYDKLKKPDRTYLVWGGMALLAVLIIQTYGYAYVYSSEDAMWSYTLKYNPNAWQAHSRYGMVVLQKGDLDAALFHFSESERLRPDLAETHNNFAGTLARKGRSEEALYHFREAYRLAPYVPTFEINLSHYLLETGHKEEALEHYGHLLKAHPGDPSFMCNYGVCLFLLGRTEESIGYFQKALAIDPGLKDAKDNLAVALKKQADSSAPPAPSPTPAVSAPLNSGVIAPSASTATPTPTPTPRTSSHSGHNKSHSK